MLRKKCLAVVGEFLRKARSFFTRWKYYKPENSTIDRNDMQLGKALTKHPSLSLSLFNVETQQMTFYCLRRIIGMMLGREGGGIGTVESTLQLPELLSQSDVSAPSTENAFSEYGGGVSEWSSYKEVKLLAAPMDDRSFYFKCM